MKLSLFSFSLPGAAATGLALGMLGATQHAQSVHFVDGASPVAQDAPGYGSKTLPFKTIRYAVAQAAPFDTVNVLPAVYQETAPIHILQPGLKLEALPEAEIVIPIEDAFSGSFYDIAILIDSTLGTVTPEALVRGFSIHENPSSNQASVAIMATEWGYDSRNPTGHDNSPVIEQNRIGECTYGIVVEAFGAGNVSAPTIVRNTFYSEESMCTDGHRISAIESRSGDSGFLEVHARANRVFGWENGHAIWTTSFSAVPGLVYAEQESNLFAFCDFGVYVEDGAVVLSLNDTVAFSSPSSLGNPVARGFWANSNQVTLVNTLVWVPDSLTGSSPCTLPGPGLATDFLGTPLLLVNSVLEDTATPGYDPSFSNVAAADFRLQPTSPAIDAGLTSAVQPGAFGAVAEDNNAGPRILDYHRSGTAEVDIGAFEASRVSLQVASAYGGSLPVEDPLSDPAPPIYLDRVYDIQTGLATAAVLELQGLPGDSALLALAPASDTNLLLPSFPFLGNLLVSPTSPLFTLLPVPLNGSGTGTLPLWSAGIPQEMAWDVQALFLDAGGTGNFARRVRLEANL